MTLHVLRLSDVVTSQSAFLPRYGVAASQPTHNKRDSLKPVLKHASSEREKNTSRNKTAFLSLRNENSMLSHKGDYWSSVHLDDALARHWHACSPAWAASGYTTNEDDGKGKGSSVS